jgi:hypothetical protein
MANAVEIPPTTRPSEDCFRASTGALKLRDRGVNRFATIVLGRDRMRLSVDPICSVHFEAKTVPSESNSRGTLEGAVRLSKRHEFA